MIPIYQHLHMVSLDIDIDLSQRKNDREEKQYKN